MLPEGSLPGEIMYKQILKNAKLKKGKNRGQETELTGTSPLKR